MNTYKTKEPYNKYFILVMVILILGMAVFFTVYDSKRIKKLHDDYYEVKTVDIAAGIITDIYVEKGATFLTINHTKKYFFHEYRNCQNHKLYFHECIQLGDSINKVQYTDTLRIVRNNKTYYFVP